MRRALEEKITQRIQKWYRQELGGKPKSIRSTFCEDRLAIVIENLQLPLEKLLVQELGKKVAMQVSASLLKVLKENFKGLIQETLPELKIVDLFGEVALDTNRLGLLVILDGPAQLLSKREDIERLVLLDPLTSRELEVLQLLALGYTNTEIGERLFLVTGTVKNHVHNIIQKFGVSDRTQVAVKAVRSGLVD